MLIDTHCHMNMMVKTKFDEPMQKNEFDLVRNIVDDAKVENVRRIINVGTSLVESNNCIEIAKRFENVYASIGIHPNDLTENWKDDFNEFKNLLKNKELNKIVAIGEVGIDMYRPGYDLKKQKDAFKAQIELALEHNLAIIVHSRSAPQETLRGLEEFKKDIKRCVIHCFSEDLSFAKQVIEWNFFIGIGGTLTYPKNDDLRNISRTVSLDNIVLETDAPFLPLQAFRGKQNNPKYIKMIAQYLADIREQTFHAVAQQTTINACKLFALENNV